MVQVMVNRVGRYDLVERLAQGGMGDVWLARDPDLGREVAVKTIRGDLTDEEIRERFLREARALAQCSHPTIVPIYDFGVEEGRPYFVMERVSGRTLAEMVERGGALPLAQAVEITTELAAALAHAHQHGVLHRDVTPSNAILQADGRVRLLDFGLVRDLGSPTSELSQHVLLGTPAYSAPEQAFGAPEEVDARADIYGLGATLFFLVAGRPPFAAPTLLGLLRMVEESPLPDSGAGSDLDTVLACAVAKQREDRYPDMDSFRAALDGLGGDSLAGGSLPRGASRTTGRGRRVTTALPALLLVAVVVTLFGWGLLGSEGEDPVAAGSSTAGPLGAATQQPNAGGSQAGSEHADLGGRGTVAEDLLPICEMLALPPRLLEGRPVVASLLAAGALGEASEVLPDAPDRARVAMMLGSLAHLQRLHAPEVFPPTLRRARDAGDDMLLAAGYRVLRGEPQAASAALGFVTDGGKDGPFGLWIRLHVLLAQAAFNGRDPESKGLEITEAKAVLAALHKLQDRPMGHRYPAFSSGLLQLLADQLVTPARLDERPIRFDPNAEEVGSERVTVAGLRARQRGRCDLAVEWLEAIFRREATPELQVQLGWLRLVHALEEGEMDLLYGDGDGLGELIDHGQLGVSMPALLLTGVHELLSGEDMDSWFGALEEQSERLGTEAEAVLEGMPWPVSELHAALGEPEVLLWVARRDLLAVLGEWETATEVAVDIHRSRAAEIDEVELRREILFQNAITRALLAGDDRELAREVVLEALRGGMDPEMLRDEEDLAYLLRDPAIRARLGR